MNIGSVGEECELQPSQSPHKKQKKSHTDQDEPDGVLADTGSVQVEAQTHDTQQKNGKVICITNCTISVEKKTYVSE